MPTVPDKKTRNPFRANRDVPLLLLALPMILYIFVFKYVTMFGVVVAFQRFQFNKGFFGSPFVGLRNFEFFFTSPDAWRTARNTVGYSAVFILLQLVTTTAVALLLFELRSRLALKFYQTTMFLPRFMSWVIVATMAYAFLNPRSGMLNRLIELTGGEAVNWYIEPGKWIFILPVAHLWKSLGMGTLIYYAALMGIDSSYYEAAEVEGATRRQMAWHISIPSLLPVMSILMILAVSNIFEADFGLFYQLPQDSAMLYPTTDVIETYVYRALREIPNLGIPMAADLYKALIGLLLTFGVNGIVRRLSPEHSLF